MTKRTQDIKPKDARPVWRQYLDEAKKAFMEVLK